MQHLYVFILCTFLFNLSFGQTNLNLSWGFGGGGQLFVEDSDEFFRGMYTTKISLNQKIKFSKKLGIRPEVAFGRKSYKIDGAYEVEAFFPPFMLFPTGYTYQFEFVLPFYLQSLRKPSLDKTFYFGPSYSHTIADKLFYTDNIIFNPKRVTGVLGYSKKLKSKKFGSIFAFESRFNYYQSGDSNTRRLNLTGILFCYGITIFPNKEKQPTLTSDNFLSQ